MRKYEEAMDHIRVTPEMRARILDNLRRADLEQSGRPSVLRFPRLKRLAALRDPERKTYRRLTGAEMAQLYPRPRKKRRSEGERHEV